jgi:cobalt-zinc-cadmium efflux system membrane fusion protein
MEFRETIRVPAQAVVDETRVARIGASVTGRITEVRAMLGQKVTKGDVLAVLNSIELSDTQLAFLRADSARTLAEKAAQRARQLFEADVISEAELQRRETELLQAEADLSAADNQLHVLGMSDKGIETLKRTREVNSMAVVVATVSGVVIDRSVTQGQVVQPADALFTVADLARVWVQAELPEKQAGLVEEGDVVQLQFPALSGRTLEGKIVFVSAIVRPETRTVTARTEVANPDRAIRPAMLATMLISDRAETRLVVPVGAVVREKEREHVFLQVGPGRYRLTPVTLAPEEQGVRAVVDGVKEGDVIVSEGAFYLNAERKQSQQ